MHFSIESGRGLPKGTPAHVFVHGMTCIFKKKKTLSATLGKEMNPRKAFRAAISELQKFKDSEHLDNEHLKRLLPEITTHLIGLTTPKAHEYIREELNRHGYRDVGIRTFFKEYHPLHELGEGVVAKIEALLPGNNLGAKFLITARDIQDRSVLIL